MDFGDMKSTSVSQTLEQLLNCILTITLVYMATGSEPHVMAAARKCSNNNFGCSIVYIYVCIL